MRKSILLLIVFLMGLGTIVAFAQEDQKVAVDQSFYEQAVKALEERKFIIKFHTVDYKGQRRKQLNDETNFLILEGDSVSYQEDSGQREFIINGGSVVYYFPEILRGNATDVKIKKNDDEYLLSMSVIVKSSKGYPTRFKMKLVLKNQQENCEITKRNHWGNQYYRATLYPIGATTVMRAN